MHARVRDVDSGVNPTGHTLILDIAERSEPLLLSRSVNTRRIIRLQEKVSYVMVSLEDDLDPSVCLDISLTRITRRRAKKRMLKRMNRRFDPVQHKDSIDNTEHVQIDMLRSHGHWPSIEELYQLYQQTNQRHFTPTPYASWLQDHLLALANHWRSSDWKILPTEKLELLVLTMDDSEHSAWQESIAALQAISGERSPVIRIVNRIDKKAVTEALEQSSHVVLAGSGIVPGLEFLVAIIQVLAQNSQCELLYTDHDQLTENHEREQPVIKPDWDPYLLETGNYIGDLCVVSTELYLHIDGLEPGTAKPAIYPFLLKARAELHRDQVIHIPGIMFSQPQRNDTSYQDRWFTQHSDELVTRAYSTLQPDVLQALPRVEIIIPTRDKEPLLRQCVESILELTDYPNYHITVVDNGSTEPATSAFHDELHDEARYDVLAYPGAFNYSAINNFAVENTQSDVLILLNNDTQIMQSDWLTRMVQACMLPKVGCVGAKLLYANGRVQHAGVVMGMKGVAGHAFRFQKSDSLSYLHKLRSPHQVSAVTAACLAVRRDTFEQLGGAG
ncbi:glycosyltransferase [Granulosicoccus antarcticus]|uniref:glycosyltransferase n=1 Tax=Granulosicoccus antarcticus TaxID=437505 RepID=UPI0012FDF362|nr:glycosyltransferase [Granulosicoccus antarcticus]